MCCLHKSPTTCPPVFICPGYVCSCLQMIRATYVPFQIRLQQHHVSQLSLFTALFPRLSILQVLWCSAYCVPKSIYCSSACLQIYILQFNISNIYEVFYVSQTPYAMIESIPQVPVFITNSKHNRQPQPYIYHKPTFFLSAATNQSFVYSVPPSPA